LKPTHWILVALSLWITHSNAKTVLVIDSYHKEYPWVMSYRQGLNQTLRSEHLLVYFEMNTKRIPRTEFPRQSQNAWLAYNELRPDLVMVADDNALELLAPKFLDNEIPFIYFGINANPREYGIASSKQYFGVLERLLIKRSMVILQEFLPLQRVLLIFDNSTTSRAIVTNTFDQKRVTKVSNIEVNIALVDTFSEWKTHIKDARTLGYDAVLVGLYQTLIDEHGANVSESDVIEWTSENIDVPPFGLWDYSVGPLKTIGGYVISGYEQGRLAGEIALKHFDGETISSMPVSANSSQLIFSKTQLQKWNLDIPMSYLQSVRIID